MTDPRKYRPAGRDVSALSDDDLNPVDPAELEEYIRRGMSAGARAPSPPAPVYAASPSDRVPMDPVALDAYIQRMSAGSGRAPERDLSAALGLTTPMEEPPMQSGARVPTDPAELDAYIQRMAGRRR